MVGVTLHRITYLQGNATEQVQHQQPDLSLLTGTTSVELSRVVRLIQLYITHRFRFLGTRRFRFWGSKPKDIHD